MRSPTMAGGLFSIDRSYFYEIGSYDAGESILPLHRFVNPEIFT